MLGLVLRECCLYVLAGIFIVLDGDDVDAVGVVLFGERHGQDAACVSCPVGVPDVLSLVDVSAGHIVRMVGPALQVHLLLSADDDFLAGVLFGDVSPFGVHMSHHDALLAWMFLSGLCREFSQEVVDSLRIAGVLHHVAPEEWNGEDDDFLTLVVGDRDDEVVERINQCPPVSWLPFPSPASFPPFVQTFRMFPLISTWYRVSSGRGASRRLAESWLPAVMMTCMFGHR